MQLLYGISIPSKCVTKPSEGHGMVKAKAPDELTEGEKIVEELTDLLEDENSKEKKSGRK